MEKQMAEEEKKKRENMLFILKHFLQPLSVVSFAFLSFEFFVILRTIFLS